MDVRQVADAFVVHSGPHEQVRLLALHGVVSANASQVPLHVCQDLASHPLSNVAALEQLQTCERSRGGV